MRSSSSSGSFAGPQRLADGTMYVQVNARSRGPGPFDVKGAPPAHEPLDLSAFLIEKEKPRVMVEQVTQTDAFRELPPPAPFRPPKTGVDASTQVAHGTRTPLFPVPRGHVLVEKGRPEDTGGVAGGTTVTTREGDVLLFNWDAEAAPLVDMIVGKTLEQARNELAHEVEFASLAARKASAVASNAADAAQAAALTAAAAAAEDARRERIAAAKAKADAERAAMAKVAACAAAHRLVSCGRAAALHALRVRGYLRDELRDALASEVLGPILADLDAALAPAAAAAASAVDAAVADALARGADVYAAAAAAEEAERKRKFFIRVVVLLPPAAAAVLRVGGGPEPAGGAGDAAAAEGGEAGEGKEGEGAAAAAEPVALHIGPVPVTRQDSVATVEAAIAQWIADYVPPSPPEGHFGCACHAHLRRRPAPPAEGDAAAGGAGGSYEGLIATAGDETDSGTGSEYDISKLPLLTGGKKLYLFLDGKRLPAASLLLSHPMEKLANLALQPIGGFQPPSGGADGAEPAAE